MVLHAPPDHFWVEQADATISQANPVSTTIYTVLAANTNVKILNMLTYVTWAVTQPNPLDIIVVVDGITRTFTQANPVTDTPYMPSNNIYNSDVMTTTLALSNMIAFDSCRGKSVSVGCRITWAVTQPTPLVCRVKWARWM